MSKVSSFFHHHANFLEELGPLLALLTSMIPMNPRDRENVDAAVQKVHEAATVVREIANEGEQLAGVVGAAVATTADGTGVYADPSAQSSNTTTTTVLTGGGAVGG